MRSVTVNSQSFPEVMMPQFRRHAALSLGAPSESQTVVPFGISGTGAPTHDAPPGSWYFRRDGTASTMVYVMVSTTWTAIPALGGAGSFTTIDASGALTVDTINEHTAAAGVTADGVLLKDSQVTTDQINEKTATAGVTVDGCLIKDGRAAALAALGMTISTEQTGTGASQNVAHGLGATPTRWLIVPSDAAAGFTLTKVSEDGTNCVVNVTAGVKFYVVAFK